MWTRCMAWAVTGMEMTPELFPHTAQLLLLSTTETKRESAMFTQKGSHKRGGGQSTLQTDVQKWGPVPYLGALELHLKVEHL